MSRHEGEPEDPLYVETLIRLYPEYAASLLAEQGYIIVPPPKAKPEAGQ